MIVSKTSDTAYQCAVYDSDNKNMVTFQNNGLYPGACLSNTSTFTVSHTINRSRSKKYFYVYTFDGSIIKEGDYTGSDIRISPNGRYIMIPNLESSPDAVKIKPPFAIFDLENNENIPIPEVEGAHLLWRDFLSDNSVLIIIRKLDVPTSVLYKFDISQRKIVCNKVITNHENQPLLLNIAHHSHSPDRNTFSFLAADHTFGTTSKRKNRNTVVTINTDMTIKIFQIDRILISVTVPDNDYIVFNSWYSARLFSKDKNIPWDPDHKTHFYTVAEQKIINSDKGYGHHFFTSTVCNDTIYTTFDNNAMTYKFSLKTGDIIIGDLNETNEFPVAQVKGKTIVYSEESGTYSLK